MHNGGFRVNAKLLKELKKRKQQVQRRIDKSNWSGSSPMIKAPSIKYELAERQQAVSAGGIGVMMQVLEKLDVRREINSAVTLSTQGHAHLGALAKRQCCQIDRRTTEGSLVPLHGVKLASVCQSLRVSLFSNSHRFG